jgi:hypothetical protein
VGEYVQDRPLQGRADHGVGPAQIDSRNILPDWIEKYASRQSSAARLPSRGAVR